MSEVKKNPKSAFQVIERVVDGLANCGLAIGVTLLFATTLLIVIEVAARKTMSWSTLIMDEYAGYFVAGITFLTFAITLQEERHIRVEFVTQRLPKRVALWLYFITEIIAMAYLAIVTYYAFKLVHNSYVNNVLAETATETPLYIPQITFPVGVMIFLMAMIVKFIKKISRLLSRQLSINE